MSENTEIRIGDKVEVTEREELEIWTVIAIDGEFYALEIENAFIYWVHARYVRKV